ncbi:MAG TPA: GNAT family N-acetyltransferase [Gaiellaceae bacterium]
MIRRSSPAEAETLWRVQRDACIAAFPHVYPPELYPFPDEPVRRHYEEFSGTILVAEVDGHVVGLAGVRDCWLNNLYVLPDHWGSGVAKELHDAALAELAPCAEVRLWTLEENHRGRRFYEKNGWRLNGETRVVPFPPNPLDVGYSYVREA